MHKQGMLESGRLGALNTILPAVFLSLEIFHESLAPSQVVDAGG